MLTEQVILKAIQKLHAKSGKIPTNKQVREYLGKGSFTQISPVLHTYKSEEAEKAKAAVQLPTELESYTKSALSELWVHACAIAARTLEEERSSFQEKLSQITIERDDALQEIGRLEREFQTVLERENQTTAQLEELQSTNQMLTQDTIKLSTENNSLSERLAEKKSEIDEMKKEARDLRHHNKDLDRKLLELAARKK